MHHFLSFLPSFRSGPQLLLLLFLLMGRPSSKGSVDSNRIWMECGRNVLQVKTHIDWRSRIFELTSHYQDGGHECHFTQKSAATRWVNTKCLRSAYVAALRKFLVYTVHSYLFNCRRKPRIMLTVWHGKGRLSSRTGASRRRGFDFSSCKAHNAPQINQLM